MIFRKYFLNKLASPTNWMKDKQENSANINILHINDGTDEEMVFFLIRN